MSVGGNSISTRSTCVRSMCGDGEIVIPLDRPVQENDLSSCDTDPPLMNAHQSHCIISEALSLIQTVTIPDSENAHNKALWAGKEKAKLRCSRLI